MRVPLRDVAALLSLALAAWPAIATAQAVPQPEDPDWTTYVIPEYGTRVQYPAGLFLSKGPSPKGVGEQFESADGSVSLVIYSQDNSEADTPVSYLGRNLRVDPATIDYRRVTSSFFAISSEREGAVYYSRCNFSGGRAGAIHCFDLIYPQSLKRAWDPVAARISLSLRPLER
ncbi:MAG TPA: hypothetical protein VGF60_00305 [Xanthobacteraceae bacterium]|jgi:hypothetical protein